MTDGMNARLQQAVPSGLIVALSLWVAYTSFNVEYPEAYLFPQLVSVVFVFVAVLAFVQVIRGKALTGRGITGEVFSRIVPGGIVMIGYVFYAVEFLGMYTASAAAFLLIFSLYDPASHALPKTWIKRLVVTLGFMAVMYGLFALALKVQTPRGLFI